MFFSEAAYRREGKTLDKKIKNVGELVVSNIF
jgi:hypothetical protein